MGVWEDLVALRQGQEKQRSLSRELFALVCLLKGQKFRDSKDRALIEHRIEQMKETYPFLEDVEPESKKLGG